MKVNALTRAVLLGVVAAALVAGCSRERIDWKSAESADTLESYDHFLQRHPDSALATQAHARMDQLVEDRDWKRASGAETADAYKQFLAQHPNGKWAEEARIRIENFTLENNPSPLTEANEAERRDAGASKSATAPATGAKPVASAPASAAATKPVAAEPASAAPKPAEPAGFGIQLGAFSSQAAALAAWKKLQIAHDHDLHGLFAHAVPMQAASGQLFRLQAPVGEESRARGICAALAKQSQPCVVVLPQPR